MQIPRKPLLIAGAGVALLGGGYALGRYVAPDRVKTVEHETIRTVTREDTEAREQVRELTAQLETMKRDTHRERTTVVHPDGTRERHETVDTHVAETHAEQRNIATDAEQRHETATETVRERVVEKLVERARPQWRIGPMVGFDLRTGTPGYGAMVERRIAGPLSLGAWGMSGWRAGLTLTLEF